MIAKISLSFSTLNSLLYSLSSIQHLCFSQQKKINYLAPIDDIKQIFGGYVHKVLTQILN